MICCASILLAAGDSSRLGSPKQVLKVKDETLLHRTARFAIEAGCSPNLVVLGAFADQLRTHLDGLAAEIVINPEWRNGMGSSLALAMHSLLSRLPLPEAVLLLVCDQPNLNPEFLHSLIAALNDSGKPIVASRYAGSAGVPALFTSALYPELAAARDDHGARAILARHSAESVYVDFPMGEFDVDTPADKAILDAYSF